MLEGPPLMSTFLRGKQPVVCMCVYLNVLWVSNVCVRSEEINVFFHQTHTKIPAVSGKIYIHWQSNVLGSESFIKSEPVPECVWVITGSFNCLTPTHTRTHTDASAHTWIIDSLSRRRIIPVIHLVEVEVLQCDGGVEKGSQGMKKSSHKLEMLQSKDVEWSQVGDYIIIIFFFLCYPSYTNTEMINFASTPHQKHLAKRVQVQVIIP